MPGSVSDAAEIVFASFIVMVTELGAESTQSVVRRLSNFCMQLKGIAKRLLQLYQSVSVFLKTPRATFRNVDRMAATTYRPSPLNQPRTGGVAPDASDEVAAL